MRSSTFVWNFTIDLHSHGSSSVDQNIKKISQVAQKKRIELKSLRQVKQSNFFFLYHKYGENQNNVPPVYLTDHFWL